MSAIFTTTDKDGDVLTVDTSASDPSLVLVTAEDRDTDDPETGAVWSDARELRDALSRHLRDVKARLQPAPETPDGFVGTFGAIDDDGDSLRVWEHPRAGSLVVEATEGKVGGARVAVEVPLNALLVDLQARKAAQSSAGLAPWERELLAATEEPFSFDLRDSDDRVSTAVFQALGAASVCWESMSGTGVFDDRRAKAIGDALVELIGETIAAEVKEATDQARAERVSVSTETAQRIGQAYRQGRQEGRDEAGRASQAREDAYAEGVAAGKAEAEAAAVAAFRLLQKVGEVSS